MRLTDNITQRKPIHVLMNETRAIKFLREDERLGKPYMDYLEDRYVCRECKNEIVRHQNKSKILMWYYYCNCKHVQT